MSCLAATAAALRPSALWPQVGRAAHIRMLLAHQQQDPYDMHQYNYAQPDQHHSFDQRDQAGYEQQSTQEQAGYAPHDPPSYVQATSDFVAEQAGDLGFQAGDVIEVVRRAETGSWWEGSLNGQVGSFPSEYCSAPYYAEQSRDDYGQPAQYQLPPQLDQYYDQADYAQPDQHGYPQQTAPQEEQRVYDPQIAGQLYEQQRASAASAAPSTVLSAVEGERSLEAEQTALALCLQVRRTRNRQPHDP